jgi:hypothetical protein
MSQFSRTDYLWLADAWAEIIASEPLATDRAVLVEAAERFAALLSQQSPTGFNPNQFLVNVTIASRKRNHLPERT